VDPPKGTPIFGETLEATALREVTEETGLLVRIISPLDAISYTFVQRGTRIHKTVHYFLMEPIGGSLDDHDREFEEVRWVSFEEAPVLLSSRLNVHSSAWRRGSCRKLPSAPR